MNSATSGLLFPHSSSSPFQVNFAPSGLLFPHSSSSPFQINFALSGLVKNRSLHTRGCAPCYLFPPFGALVPSLFNLSVPSQFRPFGAFAPSHSNLSVPSQFRPFRACKESFASYKGLRPLLFISPLRGSCSLTLQVFRSKSNSPLRGFCSLTFQVLRSKSISPFQNIFNFTNFTKNCISHLNDIEKIVLKNNSKIRTKYSYAKPQRGAIISKG